MRYCPAGRFITIIIPVPLQFQANLNNLLPPLCQTTEKGRGQPIDCPRPKIMRPNFSYQESAAQLAQKPKSIE